VQTNDEGQGTQLAGVGRKRIGGRRLVGTDWQAEGVGSVNSTSVRGESGMWKSSL
jgi:hypothetical protein